METISHVAELEGCNLIIKAAKTSTPITNLISTPEDWTLLRQCQEPVLLVHHDNSWMDGRVLAAIDACPNDSEHQVLNGVILEYAAAIAGLSDSECHIGSAHPGTNHSGDDPISKSSADARVRYEQQCQHWPSASPYPTNISMLRKGLQKLLFPTFANVSTPASWLWEPLPIPA